MDAAWESYPARADATCHDISDAEDSRYTGETTVKQTDFGIKPPGKAGVRAKDEVRIEFDVWLAS